MTNPLITTFDEAPFSAINNEHFLPAIQQAIDLKKKEIYTIVTNKEEATFANTIAALDYSGEQLSRITSIFFNLNSAETNEEIQKIAQKVSPLLAELSNDIALNEELFQKIKAVYDQKDHLDLTPEEHTLLVKNYKSFVRNGALLPQKDKEKLRNIDKELSKLGLKFGENVLAATNAYELLLTDEEDLTGLPEGAKEAAKSLATSRNKEGWLITLDYPSYIPFMKYAKNRDLRKKLAIAFGSKCYQDAHDNQENVLRIVNLRFQRAQLLGYSSHADYVLEERMAKNPESVHTFLTDLLEKSKPAAQKEFNRLEQFAKDLDQIDHLQKWDSAYYTEKLKQQQYALDDEVLKPYFKLENVIQGVFQVASKLFQLQFKKVSDVDTYHEKVKTYQVLDQNNNFVALFYADFHPRNGKRNGAWMTSYKSQMKKDGKNSRPHISIVCNFTKPTPTKPSLLTFNEVTTLFHEFGHALHGILANTTYPGLSGTSVFWDFVELPSQILENWCYEKEALQLFAKHYQTEETIPMELIDKIKKSATFMEGMATLRQLSFGFLDMSWHAQNPEDIKNVKEHENKVFEKTDLFPEVAQTCMSTSFSHIFQGGYSSGYYSYKWAEVLDADAFAFFQEKGIFDQSTATQFKDIILSKGGTEDPMKLYKQFRGKEPEPEALLKRAGLMNVNK